MVTQCLFHKKNEIIRERNETIAQNKVMFLKVEMFMF